MTLFDLAAVLIVLVYVALGYFTGTIRRVIGLVAVYVGTLVATYMGQEGGVILQQYAPTTPLPDARLYGWLFFLALIVIILEGAALAIHNQLQVSFVVLDKATGVLLGAITGAIMVLVLTFMLAGFAQPLGSGEVDNLQIGVRDSLTGSRIGYPLAKSISPALIVFQAALPGDPKTYFGTGATHR